MKSTLSIALLLIVFTYCQPVATDVPKFEHDIASGPKPWTGEVFEKEEQDFTFAIISDLTGGERLGIYNTAVAQLNRLDPTFVMSVGDLIEGATEDSSVLAREWKSFDDRTAKLNIPFFYLGGNHDLTNPTMRKFWKARFGPLYYYFKYEDVLFLMLDSEDFEEARMMEIYRAREEAMKVIRGEKPGKFEDTEYAQMPESMSGGVSDAQFEYFKKVLEENPAPRWTFLFMHKPVWMREDSKGLGRIEVLLKDRPYTVINGHLHSYAHRKRNERDYLTLGTTGGYQNPSDSMAFDHVTLVRMAEEPVITHLKMEGILDETGRLPKPEK